ncbi:hypothetical protein M9458_055332 [Cirrhinus mrigala]|uniref:Uncharacterized protein n=1 Tax=Cirrhinus mrigala TaxID=683832 RepID=A0ABD0MGD2_CIRMR
MDPLASRLSIPVTEQSVTKGSSSFSPGHSADMDTDRILCRIRQGPRTHEQHIHFALLCVGSPFTVGVAEEERDATEPLTAWIMREMAATPERVHTLASTTEPVHKMAATAVPVRKMAAAPVCAHKMAATEEPFTRWRREWSFITSQLLYQGLKSSFQAKSSYGYCSSVKSSQSCLS